MIFSTFSTFDLEWNENRQKENQQCGWVNVWKGKKRKPSSWKLDVCAFTGVAENAEKHADIRRRTLDI